MQTRVGAALSSPARPRRPRGAPAHGERVFFAALAVGLVLAWIVEYRLDITNVDSLARTVNASLVLLSRDPHLGAIGFVWPPLPTVARMPLLLITHPLGFAEFTGPITSVLFGAGVVTMLNLILRHLGFGRWTRAAWIAAAMLNPLVVLHFVNGTAESAYTFFMLVVVAVALRRRRTPAGALVGMGLASALALLVRYEAVALVGAIVAGLICIDVLESGTRERSERLGARLAVFGAPVAFAALMWLGVNWSIQGDPFFFYRGAYSVQHAPEVARNDPSNALAYAYGSLPGALWYVLQRTLQVSPAFAAGAIAVLWRARRDRDVDGLVLAFIGLSVPAMQWFQGFSGTIPPFLRYWVYLPVLAVPLWGYALRPAPGGVHGHRAPIRWGLVAVVLAASGATAGWAMTSREAGVDEQLFIMEITGRRGGTAALRGQATNRATVSEITRYLDGQPGLVMLDLDRGGDIVLRVARPERLVVNSDQDFTDIVRDPARQGVAWVLLPDPGGRSASSLARDSIYTVYPDLYGGASWLKLEREFAGTPSWRLYRVTRP